MYDTQRHNGYQQRIEILGKHHLEFDSFCATIVQNEQDPSDPLLHDEMFARLTLEGWEDYVVYAPIEKGKN